MSITVDPALLFCWNLSAFHLPNELLVSEVYLVPHLDDAPHRNWRLRDIRDFEGEHLRVSCIAELHLFAAVVALAVRCHEPLFFARVLQRRNLLEQ